MRKQAIFGLFALFSLMMPFCLTYAHAEGHLTGEYRIGSGDVLQIVTWKEPDFSRREVYVRTDGKITFPLLNDVQAAGKTTSELKKDLESQLNKYIENPVVTVHISLPGSQKFYILGEVLKPGVYDLLKRVTVLQAISLAGGFTEWASKKEIILLRKGTEKDEQFIINYKEIVDKKNFRMNLPLIADDTIIVP